MLEEAHLACFPRLVASDAILVGLTRCCKNHGHRKSQTILTGKVRL